MKDAACFEEDPGCCNQDPKQSSTNINKQEESLFFFFVFFFLFILTSTTNQGKRYLSTDKTIDNKWCLKSGNSDQPYRLHFHVTGQVVWHRQQPSEPSRELWYNSYISGSHHSSVPLISFSGYKQLMWQRPIKQFITAEDCVFLICASSLCSQGLEVSPSALSRWGCAHLAMKEIIPEPCLHSEAVISCHSDPMQ